MEKKLNHQANIVRVKEIKEHTNADSLELIIIGEYQVVSKKGQFHVGDLAVYIQPDSVVPQTEPFQFIWEQHAACNVCGNGWPNHKMSCYPEYNSKPTKVSEKHRRITVRKFRGEWSEGLLLPIGDFPELCDNQEGICNYYEGDDVSDLLGITHYDPDAGKESTKGENTHAPKARKKGYPRSLRGWYNYITRRVKQFFGLEARTDGTAEAVSLGIPVYDVESMKNHKNVFEPGELVTASEKIHGSNARYIYTDGVMYAGSRTLWKAPNSNCVWRKALKENPWIEEWCKANPDHVLWGEVTPTQGGYEYGSKNVQFFVFDIRKPDGTWAAYGSELFEGVKNKVPVFYCDPYDEEKIKALVDGPSTVPGAKNIREGIVIKSLVERHVRGLGRAQVKLVSNRFLEKDNK